MAIDTERIRHEATLDLIAKELGQDWAADPGRDGRNDYAGYAAFLRERIRCDMMSRDTVEMLLTRIAMKLNTDFQMGVDHTLDMFVDFIIERIKIDYTRNDAVDRILGRIAQAIRLPHVWKAGTPASDRVDDLVQHIAEWNSYPPQGAPKAAYFREAADGEIDFEHLRPTVEGRLFRLEKRVEALDEAIPPLIEKRIAKVIDKHEKRHSTGIQRKG